MVKSIIVFFLVQQTVYKEKYIWTIVELNILLDEELSTTTVGYGLRLGNVQGLSKLTASWTNNKESNVEALTVILVTNYIKFVMLISL